MVGILIWLLFTACEKMNHRPAHPVAALLSPTRTQSHTHLLQSHFNDRVACHDSDDSAHSLETVANGHAGITGIESWHVHLQMSGFKSRKNALATNICTPGWRNVGGVVRYQSKLCMVGQLVHITTPVCMVGVARQVTNASSQDSP